MRSFTSSATIFDGSRPAAPIAAHVANATTTIGIDHQRCHDGGSRTPACGPTEGGTGIVCSCVSVTLALSVDGLTAQAAWIAGLAVTALVLAGWRKPARARSRQPRGSWALERRPTPVDHQSAPLYRRPGPIRRVWAAVASAGLAVVAGAIAATVLSFGVAWTVVRLTSLLKR